MRKSIGIISVVLIAVLLIHKQDFEELAKKFGVYIDETLCAKAIFIINKDGQFVYKEITRDVEDELDLELFETKLDEAIHFKKKGHVHENWMGA